MPVEGAIAERTRAVLPITWDALERDPRYGDGLLRAVIDSAKEKILGEVVDPDLEVEYPILAVEYVAKIAALELITPGIDFWMNQPTSESATGTNEVHTFTERANELRELRKILLEDTRSMLIDVIPLITRRVRRTGFARISTFDEDFITPSPLEFPRPYAPTDRT